MKLSTLRIQNFRAFSDETISFDDYTCLVGPNGAGKSTVLCALNVFFRNSSASPTDLITLNEQDFHARNTNDPIIITLTFTNLSPAAKQAFSNYVRHDALVISARADFDKEAKSATVKQFGQRQAMKDFAPFFEAEGDGKLVKELQPIYKSIVEKYPDLPKATTKPQMVDALHSYETAHPDLCTLLPSSDEFYGFSKGANLLKDHVLWVFMPAVKDATTEQLEAKNTALGQLLARTIRTQLDLTTPLTALRADVQQRYQDLLDGQQGVLTDLSTKLANRLRQWAHPDANLRLSWQQEAGKSVKIEEPFAGIITGEGSFEGELARFGHGLQRSYLLALLQELAATDSIEGPRLLLGCEEPELYQHPPQARHLARVLEQLTQKNTQVVVCTHSPYFVTGRGFEDIRLTRKDRATSNAAVSQVSPAQLGNKLAEATGDAALRHPLGALAKLHQELQPSLNEMFFSPFLVLVEGIEDVAYVTTHMHLLDLWDEFRRLGGTIISANGKSHMIQPRALASLLSLPTFTIFDSDAHQPDKNGSRAKHHKDNLALLKLSDSKTTDTQPAQHLWEENLVMWASEMGAVFASDCDPAEFAKVQAQVEQQYGQVGGLEKNQMAIAERIIALWTGNVRSATLEKLCKEIIRFGQALFNGPQALPAPAPKEAQPAPAQAAIV